MTICSCPAASAAFRWIITAFYIFRMFFPSPDSPNRKRVCLHVVFALLFLGKWWQNRCPPRSISRWPLSWTSCLHVCQCLTWLCVCVALLLHLWCVIHSVLVQVWLSSSRTCGSVVLVKPVWNTGRFQIWLCNCCFFFFSCCWPSCWFWRGLGVFVFGTEWRVSRDATVTGEGQMGALFLRALTHLSRLCWRLTTVHVELSEFL